MIASHALVVTTVTSQVWEICSAMVILTDATWVTTAQPVLAQGLSHVLLVPSLMKVLWISLNQLESSTLTSSKIATTVLSTTIVREVRSTGSNSLALMDSCAQPCLVLQFHALLASTVNVSVKLTFKLSAQKVATV
jgi:hypothetical protein